MIKYCFSFFFSDYECIFKNPAGIQHVSISLRGKNLQPPYEDSLMIRKTELFCLQVSNIMDSNKKTPDDAQIMTGVVFSICLHVLQC